MKKLFLFIAVFIIAAIVVSFKPYETAPKLYPELEAYFKSVEAKDISQDHLGTLENLKYEIDLSGVDYDDWNLIFYCSENTFRSQAAQIFLQTLCYAKKRKMVKVFSAGLTSGEVNSKLIEYLISIGYRVTKSEKEGKTMYEVKFSDKAEPVTLFSKTAADKSMPKGYVRSVIVCDVAAETDCAPLKNREGFMNLAFPKVDTSLNDEKIRATLKDIAAEMVYATK